ncbi:MAG: hypothetical protein E7188_07170 [Erysipelotrichaceae bacterium]|nr:hypothetical protein [Erysipelotrichaceae bacterium]
MKKKESLPGNEPGFITVWFAAAMIVICAMNAVLLVNLNRRAEVIHNIRRENLYLAAESRALDELRCRLENGEELTSPVTLSISHPAPETLIVTLHDGHIYDYETVRKEAG